MFFHKRLFLSIGIHLILLKISGANIEKSKKAKKKKKLAHQIRYLSLNAQLKFAQPAVNSDAIASAMAARSLLEKKIMQ